MQDFFSWEAIFSICLTLAMKRSELLLGRQYSCPIMREPEAIVISTKTILRNPQEMIIQVLGAMKLVIYV